MAPYKTMLPAIIIYALSPRETNGIHLLQTYGLSALKPMAIIIIQKQTRTANRSVLGVSYNG